MTPKGLKLEFSKQLFVTALLFEVVGKCLATSAVVSVHEQRDRYWPISNPSQFGIAAAPNTEIHNIEMATKIIGKPTLSFQTKSGKTVAVFDDVFDFRMMTAWEGYMNIASLWRFHDYNDDGNIPWTTTFDVEMFSTSESSRRMLSLIKSLPHQQHHGDGDFKPYKITCNILRRGDPIHVHRGTQNETEFTAVLYMNQLWRKNDYGEILFYDEGDLFAAVTPKFNRIVVWDSSIDYLTRPPSVSFKQSQTFLMVQYTQNCTKVDHFKQVRVIDAVEQKQAEAALYQDMEDSINKIDIGKYVTKKYASKSGKKIFVFDDLFNPADVDKLRMFILKHGKYYFDDSVDIDSDNVQWIAGFDIDAFIQSKLWNITRQVAKYVSGSNKLFPYDIACNLVRSFDHTRIHEDCEKEEDEWTFLLYLTPNWTANHYGETVFIEKNSDDAENIASVLPRYGRVVIFQGVIPHSARPPSSTFTGARLSFAVKLSVNSWIARIKMLRQEFGHEEIMHQTVLSLLKYYNDPNLEGHYKQELLSLAQENDEMEIRQRQEYLRSLQGTLYHGNHEERDDEDDDEDDDDDDDGEEFEFFEDHPQDDDSEFEEINRRREYIYNLPQTLNHDAVALTKHYKQFIKDRNIMEESYRKEIEKLL